MNRRKLLAGLAAFAGMQTIGNVRRIPVRAEEAPRLPARAQIRSYVGDNYYISVHTTEIDAVTSLFEYADRFNLELGDVDRLDVEELGFKGGLEYELIDSNTGCLISQCAYVYFEQGLDKHIIYIAFPLTSSTERATIE